MNAGDGNKACEAVSALLVFYVCDEVNEQERAAIESHLAECAACRAQLGEEQDFQKVVSSPPQVADEADAAGILLAQCRSELAEKLDDLERPASKGSAPAFGWLRAWMMLHPTWSAGTLVLVGLVAGNQYAQWSSSRGELAGQEQVVNVRPSSQLTDDQLSKMAVAGINFTPSPYSGSKNVRVRLNEEQPIELNGNADDSNVRSVLTFVVKNGERFDSGVRLDCLDALKAHAQDSVVRTALLTAARSDTNPAVRLKALEALHDTGMDGAARQILLDVLRHDANPGVRVEAVNLLVRSLEEAQSQAPVVAAPHGPAMPAAGMIQAGTQAGGNDGSIENLMLELQNLQQNDPSRYVRLRSTAALREINARNDQ
jgi:putative zinc finger protein